ncbi:FAD binding domain-containing protein [Chloroflexota bacterium]
MILEYHKPDNLSKTLELLARRTPMTVPMGGGTVLNQPSSKPVAVVDLQSLDLNTIIVKGNKLQLGATVTLQQLLESDVVPALNSALRHEATYNIRQVATIAGVLVASDGRSAITTAILALDAELDILPDKDRINLGRYLLLQDERNPNHLITQITIPNNIELAYQYVARTPADLPIVCAAVVQWPSGRTRVTLGGYGSAPVLAMDGQDSDGAVSAAQDAYCEAGDQWASASYRSDVAGILVSRCIQTFAN